jgi:hypothetical protein
MDAISELTAALYATKYAPRMYPDFRELLSVFNAHSVRRLAGPYISFGVRHQCGDEVRVTIDFEIKTPGFIDTGLPAIIGFVVFLGVQGGVEQIVIFIERALVSWRQPSF